MPEWILCGGLVVDGSGGPGRRADVAIADGRISAVGDLNGTAARQRVDIGGLVVAPGFIDAHSHDDCACIEQPDMRAKLSQGVTTVIVGNCGLSAAPLQFDGAVPEPFNLLGADAAFRYPRFRDYVRAVDAAQPCVNVAGLVGHSSLRHGCVADLRRAATPQETARMGERLRDALADGALGLSSGVYYAPAQAAGVEELAALAAIAAAAGGIYAVHIRDEYDGVAAALTEAFETASRAGAALVVSHHKCAGVRNWGRSSETLALIDAAAKRAPVALDCYPYTAGASVLNPELADGEIDVLIGASATHPAAAGRYLKDIAAEWGIDQRSAAQRLVPGLACYFQIDDADMRRILSHASCMVGSDGLPASPRPHPRLWGTFPRVLGRAVRDWRLFPLETAVAKMTGLPARRFGLRDRGVLAPGAIADVTVFDPAQIADRATFENPQEPSIGIEHVFVRGVHAWCDGTPTQARAGRWVARA